MSFFSYVNRVCKPYETDCLDLVNPIGLDAPDQGADQRPWANLVEINLTFSRLISIYLLNFRLKLYTYFFYHFITD
jgi:hypothetical protein